MLSNFAELVYWIFRILGERDIQALLKNQVRRGQTAKVNHDSTRMELDSDPSSASAEDCLEPSFFEQQFPATDIKAENEDTEDIR